MRKSLTIILSIFFWIIFISCANDDDENTATHNIETTLMITDDGGNESSVFDQGEDIKFEIEMYNFTNETQTLKYSSSQIYDIEIYDLDDNLIWNWANGKAFTAALTELDFSPYETKTFKETWDQVSNEGMQASVEMYDAYVINKLSAGEIIAGPYPFEIR
jgi:hypothetical protein